MGILGQALASGFANAAKGASDVIDTGIKYSYMDALEKAKGLREENLAMLKENRADTRSKNEQEGMFQREVYKYNSAPYGYDENGQPVTVGQAATMAPEDRAIITNVKAYESDLAKDKNVFAGVDKDGTPWTVGQLLDYAKDPDTEGTEPEGFQYKEQMEMKLKADLAKATQQKADADTKRADAAERRAAAYENKTLNSGEEKPLTAAQKLANIAKVTSMTTKAKEDAAGGPIDQSAIDSINEIRAATGMDPLVQVEKIVKPAEKNMVFPDVPARKAWSLVPMGSQDQGGGIVGSASKGGRPPIGQFFNTNKPSVN